MGAIIQNELYNHCKAIAEDMEAILDGNPEAIEEYGEDYSLWDYICDAIDIEITAGITRQYRGGKVYVTLGGPNIWVDTTDGYVHGAWGSDRAEYPVSPYVINNIDAMLYETFEI